jgi:hypothetical protein
MLGQLKHVGCHSFGYSFSTFTTTKFSLVSFWLPICHYLESGRLAFFEKWYIFYIIWSYMLITDHISVKEMDQYN